MLSPAIAVLRKFVHGLVANNSSGQLAAGFAIGMIIGLVPKGNLIALSLCVLLFSLRCNQGLALVAAVMFSCVGCWTDSVAHKIGQFVLSLQSLQATYASMFNLPLGPWIGFNNTVVAGSLLMGTFFAYPAYTITRVLALAIQAIACALFGRRPVPQPGAAP